MAGQVAGISMARVLWVSILVNEGGQCNVSLVIYSTRIKSEVIVGGYDTTKNDSFQLHPVIFINLIITPYFQFAVSL